MPIKKFPKKEYLYYANNFNQVKEEIEKRIVRVEYYKGPFYEVAPYSYQLSSNKKGKRIKDISKIKTMCGVYIYGFDENNRLIEIKEGLSQPDCFYYEFLFYDSDQLTQSLCYTYVGYLANTRSYLYQDNKVIKLYSQGGQGRAYVDYFYGHTGRLERMEKHYFTLESDDKKLLQIYTFYYQIRGKLARITKSYPNTTLVETIYTLF